MIAGDARLRALDSVGMGPYGTGLGWFCHGGGGVPDVTAVGFPKNFTSCPNGLAAAITMPSCWNGQSFDPTNPSAHMAYPVADNLVGMVIAFICNIPLLICSQDARALIALLDSLRVLLSTGSMFTPSTDFTQRQTLLGFSQWVTQPVMDSTSIS